MKCKEILLLVIPFYCLLACSLVTGRDAEAKNGLSVEIDKKVMQTHMDRVGAFVKWLDEAIKKKKWDKITLYAKHVDSLGEMLLSEKWDIDTKDIPQEFFEIDQKFQESRGFIIETSEKKDTKGLRSEFKRFQETCKQCHAKYKK